MTDRPLPVVTFDPLQSARDAALRYVRARSRRRRAHAGRDLRGHGRGRGRRLAWAADHRPHLGRRQDRQVARDRADAGRARRRLRGRRVARGRAQTPGLVLQPAQEPHVELQDGPVKHDYLAREVPARRRRSGGRARSDMARLRQVPAKTEREIPVFVLEPMPGSSTACLAHVAVGHRRCLRHPVDGLEHEAHGYPGPIACRTRASSTTARRRRCAAARPRSGARRRSRVDGRAARTPGAGAGRTGGVASGTLSGAYPRGTAAVPLPPTAATNSRIGS